MCRLVCIILGAVAGALAWYILSGVMSGFPLLLLSAMVFIATAWMLHETFCGEETSTSAKMAAGTAAAVATGAAASKMGKSDRDAWASSDAASGSKTAAETAPVASLVSESASTKSVAKPAAKKTTKKKAAPKKTAAKSAASKSKSTAAKPAAKKAPAKKAPAKKAGPERLKKPKGGKGDDLKLISGVGPKLEGTLNGLGFWHFEQIAKWKKADVKVVDDELSFKGRIERDDWIKQAKALAKGEAEYIKVFGKKPR